MESAGPGAPLTGLGTAVGGGVAEGDSQGLDQIATAGTHTGPQGKTVLLGARNRRENESGVGLPDPALGRAEREGRAEADLVLSAHEIGAGSGEKSGGSGGTHVDDCWNECDRDKDKKDTTKRAESGEKKDGKGGIWRLGNGTIQTKRASIELGNDLGLYTINTKSLIRGVLDHFDSG